jgi:AcrR family transcriptional regulator
MDVVSQPNSRESLTARKQKATRARIATAAAQSVAENGLAGATVEQIAAAAEIGRATFFRYFSSKEDAVAEGMTTHWLDLITDAIARQPTHLSAGAAVVAAFEGLGDGFDAISGQVRELASLTRRHRTRGSATTAAWRARDGVHPDRPRRLADPRWLAARPCAIGVVVRAHRVISA